MRKLALAQLPNENTQLNEHALTNVIVRSFDVDLSNEAVVVLQAEVPGPGGQRLPGPFHPGLFRLLHRLAVPVVPVTIRYGDRRAYWTDDTSLVSHLWTGVLAGRSLRAAVQVGAALDPRVERDGESLARAAYRAVSRSIEPPSPGRTERSKGSCAARTAAAASRRARSGCGAPCGDCC